MKGALQGWRADTEALKYFFCVSVAAFDCHRQEFAAIYFLHQDWAEYGEWIDDLLTQTGNFQIC